MTAKPRCVISQTDRQTICSFASYCNYFGYDTITYEDFVERFKVEYFPNCRSFQSCKTLDARRKMLETFIGKHGISSDVIKIMFAQDGITYATQPLDTLQQIKNGFLGLMINDSYRHMVCIKNGWVIDSINAQVYRWAGRIKNTANTYRKYSVMWAMNMDREPPNEVVGIIDLS